MKVLCFMGSPKKKGNADLLLDRAIAALASHGIETEKVNVASAKIAPCLACGGCERTGKCVVRDGMDELTEKIETADGIIVSTPIFFMGVPAQLKALVDRGQQFWVRKYRLSDPKEPRKTRPGVLIAVGGTNFPNTFDGVKLEIRSFFHCIDVKCINELLLPGIDEHGTVADHPEALNKAYAAGEALAKALTDTVK